ncbi:putative lipase [Golovinomyces cichoracearum]|uniref:Putative lipase n=1 Tax=Golovinomyces cichoracearum TaxID=62708 RepID=A0A420IQW4_9PEZI|nr:putative lipase [Golovinomyces cichoracearum]
MVYIPFFTRLNLTEYIALIGSFILVGLEVALRIFTLTLPSSVISLFYRASRKLFNCTSSSKIHKVDTKKSNLSTSIRNAADFVELCGLFGYYAEEHVVQTRDGYMLGIHRLAWKKGEHIHPVNHGEKSPKKKVIYLHHGLLMSSEVWVCLTDEDRCLPFRLVEQGFDVWLGNNRGNKYSKKNMHISPNSTPFWNFSIDEFAFYDIPDTIQYILQTTSAKSLSYIGFSQGTAQAFATLAVHPMLNDQVNVFIGLAPAMSPAGLSNSVVDALIKASPQCLFLLFGHRSILSSTTTWQSILYPPIYCRLIDMALSFLFAWHVRNIHYNQKLAAYSHLYSFTSTKSVVHWFQIIRSKCFHMYDDDQSRFLSLGAPDKFTKVAKFPTRNIKSPIYLIYGGSDSLVDITVMLRELPIHTVTIQVPHYEHLDFLWAREVDSLVFPHIFDALDNISVKTDSIQSSDQDETCHRSINGFERLASFDVASDLEIRQKGSSDTVSTPFESERNISLNDITETPTNKVFQINSCFEPKVEERISLSEIIGTPTSTAFQSSLPRPSQNTRKRTRVHTDFTNSSQDFNYPKYMTGSVSDGDQLSLMALDGYRDNQSRNLGSNIDYRSKKCSSPSVKLFSDKAQSVNGFLNNYNVKNKCVHDRGKEKARSMSNRASTVDVKQK